MEFSITHKNLLDSGLKQQFITGLDKRYLEYDQSKKCLCELKSFIYKNEPTPFQKKLIARYIRHILQYKRENPVKWKQHLQSGIIGGAGGALGSVATGGIVSAVGFTSSGVAAGSIAAGTQAAIGAVKAGSTFATLQSLGATSAFTGPVGLLSGTAIGLGVVAGKKVYDKIQNKNWQQDNKQILSFCKQLESCFCKQLVS